MNDDYDSPWKEVVMHHFPEFMAFYFPQAHAQIDWSLPHVFLDHGFGWQQLGCTMQLDFPIAKMQDYAYLIPDLASQENAFALVSAAHLLAQNTRNDAH